MAQTWLYVGIVSGLLSVGVAIYLYFWVMRQDAGSEKAQQVAGWIREGAASYLKRLYSALTLVAVILGLVIAIVFSFNMTQIGSSMSISIPPMVFRWLWYSFSAPSVPPLQVTWA